MTFSATNISVNLIQKSLLVINDNKHLKFDYPPFCSVGRLWE